MENSKEKRNIQRRNDRLHFNEFESSYDRKLKTANKARINRQLFLEGFTWCHEGKNLEDATDMVKIDDIEIAKKDNINFKRGYEEGTYELGFRYGYDFVPYDNIPDTYALYDKCKMGYRDGQEKRVLDDSKGETKSHR